jgi:hypothetical protein
VNLLKPKVKNNYIKKNKEVVKEMEIGRIPRNLNNERNELHDEYGKVPK